MSTELASETVDVVTHGVEAFNGLLILSGTVNDANAIDDAGPMDEQ